MRHLLLSLRVDGFRQDYRALKLYLGFCNPSFVEFYLVLYTIFQVIFFFW